VTRLSDKHSWDITSNPQVIDGMSYSITGTAAAAGDNYLVRPTINGAANLKLTLSDVSQVAAAAPIATSAPLTNRGTGKISEGMVNKDYLASPLTSPVTITYSGGNLSGFPAGQQVTMSVGGVASPPYAPGAPVPFKDGATYTVAGMTFTLNGAPLDGDTFGIQHNTGGGDTRNAALLGDLQSKQIFEGGRATYQSAYAHIVGTIGNKTREVQVNGAASAAQLEQAQGAANNVAGVNLDEEAANLLKYQQAYQACGKVMQVADTIFNALLSIGH
jgi:flagellar hook-associated protein 1 FlgK